MKTIATKLLLVGTLFSLAALLPGCKDDETDAPYKLFVPSKATATAEYNTITVHWTQTKDAVGYEVAMATDNTFSEILETRNQEYIPDTDDSHKTEYDVVFEDLEPFTTYYFRLKTLSADPSRNSNYSYREATTGEEAPFFDPIEEGDLGYNSVKLSWSEAVNADKIIFTDKASAVEELTLNLSPEALERQSISLRGRFVPGVTYRAKMYLGEEYIGYIDIPFPSAENYITETSVGFDFATLTWNEKLFVNKVVLTSAGGTDGPFTKELTTEEINAHQATITGLTSGATYKATLYWDAQELTQSADITTNVLDGEIVSDPATLKEKIENAADGAKLYLPADLVFDYSEEDLPLTKNITLVGLPSSTTGKSTPLIYVKAFTIGGAAATGDLQLNSIRFENLEISGLMPEQDIATTAPNNRCFYVDIAGRSVTLNSFELVSCTIHGYSRYMFGLEPTDADAFFRVYNIMIDDCIIYDLGRNPGGFQSIFHFNANKGNANYALDGTLTMKNSTIYNIWYGIIELQKNSCIKPEPSNLKVVIENCTMDKFGVPMEGVYLPVKTNGSTRNGLGFNNYTNVPVTIQNTLFGQFIYIESGTLETGSRGPKDFHRNCINAMPDFVNSNYVGEGTRPDGYSNTRQLRGADKFALQGISYDLMFPNRATDDYTPADDYKAKGLGDPRWLK